MKQALREGCVRAKGGNSQCRERFSRFFPYVIVRKRERGNCPTAWFWVHGTEVKGMVTFRLAQPSLPRYVAKRDRPFFCLQITAPRALLVLAALLSAAIWTRGFAQSPDKRNAGSCCRRDESSCYNCKLNAEFATANATEAFRTARFLCAIGKHARVLRGR